MENEILDILEDIGYSGDIKDEESLNVAVKGTNGGPKNLAFGHLVSWITEELRVLNDLEERVTPLVSPEDHSSFIMEVCSFIKELGCPHNALTEGSMSQRLSTDENRLLLLSFLLGELQAAQIFAAANPNQGMKVELKESEQAKDLKTLLIALHFPKPPANISPKQLFVKVKEKVANVLSKAHPSLVGEPLFNGHLTDKQWNHLNQMQLEMNSEYRMRRQMLIKRLDVTIQSFQWSERAKEREDDLCENFRRRRDVMNVEPDVTLGHLIAARKDLAVLEKTSNAAVRRNTKTKLNKVIIGAVPDRGGRATEHDKPPPEMPSWTQRTAGPPGGGGGRGGARGGGGFSSDRVQGGWNQGGGGYQNQRGGGGYQNQRGGGGYQNQRGGGHAHSNGGFDNGQQYSSGRGNYNRGRGRGRGSNRY